MIIVDELAEDAEGRLLDQSLHHHFFHRQIGAGSSTWLAIQASKKNRRDAILLAAIADRYIADLPEYIATALDIGSSVRRILISAEQQRHILHRRQVVSQFDADLCARRLSEAISNIEYLILPQRDNRVFELVSNVPSVKRRLLIALKLVNGVNSKSGHDELWIRTAYPFGKRTFRRRLARAELRQFPDQ